jgi:hypothetical protein
MDIDNLCRDCRRWEESGCAGCAIGLLLSSESDEAPPPAISEAERAFWRSCAALLSKVR